TMLHLCGRFATETRQRRLALAGGVALNCTANGKLLCSGTFDDIYVQPAAGDDGSALGAALYRSAAAGEIRNERLGVPFLGPGYRPADIDAALAQYRDRVQVERLATLGEACAEAARLIAGGRVVAWYRGRMEFGPRALGHRSILADPGHPEMRDRINAMVKMREAFRPFAPAVSIEEVDRWFEVAPKTELPFMIMTVNVREEFRHRLPAITHVNGSARAADTITPWPSATPGAGVAPCSPKYASSPCSLRSSPDSCSRTPALAPSVACTSPRMTAVPAAAIATAARIATSCTPIWAKLPASQPSPPAG